MLDNRVRLIAAADKIAAFLEDRPYRRRVSNQDLIYQEVRAVVELYFGGEKAEAYCHGHGSCSHGALDIDGKGTIHRDGRGASMKVTERTLVDMCRRINNEQLKHWDSGLKVERRAEDYVALRLFRKPQQRSPGSLDLFRGSPREVSQLP